MNHLIQKEALPKKATKLQVYDSNQGKPCLYILLKIHEPNHPGQPLYLPSPVSRFMYQNANIFKQLIPTFCHWAALIC